MIPPLTVIIYQYRFTAKYCEAKLTKVKSGIVDENGIGNLLLDVLVRHFLLKYVGCCCVPVGDLASRLRRYVGSTRYLLPHYVTDRLERGGVSAYCSPTVQ
jgi:hypothetical protein